MTWIYMYSRQEIVESDDDDDKEWKGVWVKSHVSARSRLYFYFLYRQDPNKAAPASNQREIYLFAI